MLPPEVPEEAESSRQTPRMIGLSELELGLVVELLELNSRDGLLIMLGTAMWRILGLLNISLLSAGVFAASVWEIPERQREILIDGFLGDWEGISGMIITPGEAGLISGGGFSGEDVRLRLMGLWDKEYLYLAAEWHDDTWDIQEISRRNAVWIDSSRKRRDRMVFFDNLKFHIRKSDYDYTFWVSPRVDDRGPYSWSRLLEGFKGMERATSAPMISVREHDGYVTFEVILLWEQLRIKPKRKLNLPLTLLLADSDWPGSGLDSKVELLKSLEWRGRLKLVK